MKINNAFTIHYCLIVLYPLAAMPNKRALDSLIPLILNMMQILYEKSILVEVERLIASSVQMHSSE
jgi:hypothetical protein